MAQDLVIALAQVDPHVGDLEGNLALHRAMRAEAAAAGAHLVVFPELSLVGYPPEDLVLKPALARYARAALAELAADTADGGPAIVAGLPWREGDGEPYNAVALLQAGGIAGHRFKHELPNYGVFDEKRVFRAGPVPGPVPLRLPDGSTLRLGLMICEDMWFADVAEGLAESGAELLLVPNGSPFEAGKTEQRLSYAIARVTETGLPLLYVNQVGGQDELVFDGGSFVLDQERRLVAQARAFEPQLLLSRWRRSGESWVPEGPTERHPPPGDLEAIYAAMVLGLRDYVEKNRFPGVVLGLSGGIDSALSAAVAVDALGPARVHCVMLPSRYTAQQSLDDAAAVAAALGVRYDTIPIEPAVGAFAGMLEPLFAGRPADVTEENIQSRIRGVTLMALSNKLGAMVLTTGNKSEMSVGYATLYGDMCGGYSVLKDVWKTTVFALARWRNAHKPRIARGPDGIVVPDSVIVRPPTAELRADQTDQDTLPPYEILDAILQGLVEEDLAPVDLVGRGFPPETVRLVSNLLDLAEYKRRQAPPGVKITRRAFGRDRRYPITNAFRRLGLRPFRPPA
jgi:NAD+ synthase